MADLLPHQQRVVDERDELDEKLLKLIAFFSTPTFAQLPAEEQDRLRMQVKFMDGYSTILQQRIEAFPPIEVQIGP